MRDHTLKTIIDVTSDGGRVFAEHHTPDDAAEILKAENDDFLFRQYLERKAATTTK